MTKILIYIIMAIYVRVGEWRRRREGEARDRGSREEMEEWVNVLFMWLVKDTYGTEGRRR